uniref:Uncharacterized protein n=1 Tax=Aegilops tauschii subsp. strangulata TaxID=200361 RepID=A0A453PJG6_AEGTS
AAAERVELVRLLLLDHRRGRLPPQRADHGRQAAPARIPGSLACLLGTKFIVHGSIYGSRFSLSSCVQYAVIDFLWYRKNANGSGEDSYGFDSVDQWGRPFPDPERFPSSAGGEGFKHVADKVHAMGLKFGIHLMNGISTQAVNASTPILDVDT